MVLRRGVAREREVGEAGCKRGRGLARVFDGERQGHKYLPRNKQRERER